MKMNRHKLSCITRNIMKIQNGISPTPLSLQGNTPFPNCPKPRFEEKKNERSLYYEKRF